MLYLLNCVYLCLVVVASPWIVYKSITTGKYRRGILRKFLGRAVVRDGTAPCAWFHGVSVGEIHLLRQVVAQFRQRHPDWDCVVSTTTDTGYDEALRNFPDLQVFYWPLDFSWAVRRALLGVKPSIVVLAEGELWPNFLRVANDLGILVCVANGRLSPRSVRNYHRARAVVRPLFATVDLWAVQSEAYALAVRRLGAVPQRVHVTGSVKFDGVTGERGNARTRELRTRLDVRPGDRVWVAGSTQAPEEEITLEIYRRARERYPSLRFFLVPRQKDRFDAVAGMLRRSGLPFVRRSELTGPLADRSAVVLVDTMGELGALWGLADVAFVGGSLDGRRGGQNMIEPAAYGAAIVFGPHVWNFHDTAERLTAAGAAVQVADAAGLEAVVLRLLGDAEERERRGTAARQFVRSQQGATARTLDRIDSLLVTPKRCAA